MSTTTTADLNGTNGTTEPTVRNRLRGNGTLAVTKFQRLYALAGKSDRKGFSLKRGWEGEGSISLRMEGFPETLDAAGIAKLASESGAKEQGSISVGAASGGWSAVLIGRHAADTVKEMTEE